MPRREKSTDKDIIDQLLASQDDVIGQLDQLESRILETIASITASRQEQQLKPATSTADKSKTIRMPHSQPHLGKGTDDKVDQSFKAA